MMLDASFDCHEPNCRRWHNRRLMRAQVARENNEALSQVREVASDETVEARRVQHASNHFKSVIAGVEQRDYLLGGGRDRLSRTMCGIDRL